MRYTPNLFHLLLIAGLLASAGACKHGQEKNISGVFVAAPAPKTVESPLAKIPVSQEVNIGGLFAYFDQIKRQYDSICPYPVSDNLLLRANPWLLDTLVSTDYYYRLSKGECVYDQPGMKVLRPGDTLYLPGVQSATVLLEKMKRTWLDINIPAFELRVMENDSVLFRIPVRVGKNQRKFLEMARHSVDLRTRTGAGEIIRVNREPAFYDPVTGKQFYYTRRDDHKTTLMPKIPWLEPAIGGRRLGQMIHPTTNPRTLGKAASNGCIGISEADGWRVFAYAPLGTRVVIRYDLESIDPVSGDTLHFPDIYRLRSGGKLRPGATLASWEAIAPEALCQCDSLF